MAVSQRQFILFFRVPRASSALLKRQLFHKYPCGLQTSHLQFLERNIILGFFLHCFKWLPLQIFLYYFSFMILQLLAWYIYKLIDFYTTFLYVAFQTLFT